MVLGALHFPGTEWDRSTGDEGAVLAGLVTILGVTTAPAWLPAAAAQGAALAAAHPALSIKVLLTLSKMVLVDKKPRAAVAELGVGVAEDAVVAWLEDLYRSSRK